MEQLPLKSSPATGQPALPIGTFAARPEASKVGAKAPPASCSHVTAGRWCTKSGTLVTIGWPGAHGLGQNGGDWLSSTSRSLKLNLVGQPSWPPSGLGASSFVLGNGEKGLGPSPSNLGQPRSRPGPVTIEISSEVSAPTSPTTRVPGSTSAGLLEPVPGSSAMRQGCRTPSAHTRERGARGAPASKKGLPGTPLPVAGSRRRILPLRESTSCARQAPMTSLGWRRPSARAVPLSGPPKPSPAEASSVPSSPNTIVPVPWVVPDTSG